ncbi:MAG: sulfotransferase family protein [Myxococcota bacterium]
MSDPSRAVPAFSAPDRITVVSGLPRAGTSLLMQILEAAGLEIARDDMRPPDPDNPRGYFELAAVKAIRRDAGFVDACVGRVVKIVAPLVPDLPRERAYRFLVVERDLGEILASQRAMLRRLARSAASDAEDAALARAYQAANARARAWIAAAPDAPALFVAHAELLASPAGESERIADFLEGTGAAAAASAASRPAPGREAESEREPAAAEERRIRRRTTVAAMSAVVDPRLYRCRAGS